jgi:hypothetical protein
VNTGLVVSGGGLEDGRTGVIGDAVNLAARLQQEAEPGQILVSNTVWRRIRDRYEGEPVGAVAVKGREQPVEVHRITGVRGSLGRRRSPFVGRERELAVMELLWSGVEQGEAHVLSVIGEPGVGKSRLLSEMPIRPGALDVRLTDASAAVKAFLPVASRFGGSVFLAPFLTAQGEVESLRGERAEAERVLREAVEIVSSGGSRTHAFVPLVPAARILPGVEVVSLLDRCRELGELLGLPVFGAAVKEAEGLLAGDGQAIAEAARLYGEAGLPYRQAVALAAAGSSDEARTIVERIGAVLPPAIRSPARSS